MDNQQKEYYQSMLHKDRLLPFSTKNNQDNGDRLVCIITFYIGINNKDKYIRDNMWSVIEDEPDGTICWVDHLITDKNPENPRLSYVVWHEFKKYIKTKHPQVKEIRWNRYNFITTKSKEVKYDLYS